MYQKDYKNLTKNNEGNEKDSKYNRLIFLPILGILLSYLPIYLYINMGWWPFFSYLLYMAIAFSLIFVPQLYLLANLTDENKYIYLLFFLTFALNVPISLYPYIYETKCEIYFFVDYMIIGTLSASLILAVMMLYYFITFNYRQRKYLKYQEEKEKEKAAFIELLIEDYGQEYADLILQHQVRIGMTDEMCRESWGEPMKINRTVYSWGVQEQWVYYNDYLYFEDGELTTIQNR